MKSDERFADLDFPNPKKVAAAAVAFSAAIKEAKDEFPGLAEAIKAKPDDPFVKQILLMHARMLGHLHAFHSPKSELTEKL